MQIIVSIKTVYGNEQVYPVCDQAKIFSQMAGTKTLTRSQLELIKRLGYEIKLHSVGSICFAS